MVPTVPVWFLRFRYGSYSSGAVPGRFLRFQYGSGSATLHSPCGCWRRLAASRRSPPGAVAGGEGWPAAIFVSEIEKQGDVINQRKIRLREGNAKCCHLKKFTCNETLRQVFKSLKPRTPYPPPLYSLFTCKICYLRWLWIARMKTRVRILSQLRPRIRPLNSN